MSLRAIPPDRAEILADLVGLTTEAAAERRARFGFNDIVVAAPSTWRDVAADTLRDPMIWFLVGVGLLYAFLGDFVEAAVLGLAILPLVGMDVYLHGRTQASTSGLARRLASEASVWRDGGMTVLPAREVVPGDLVAIGPGAQVPADGLLVAGTGVQIDESSLTGESYPVEKRPIGSPTRPLREADTVHWLSAGTRVLTGNATVRILLTGEGTLYGEIVRSAVARTHTRTPLQVGVSRVVAGALVAAIVFCAALGAILLVQGHSIVEALVGALTLAVAALPEEFPIVLTFFLGFGVYRLAHRQALVRRAVAVENIGRVTSICSDKTGTLTEGKLSLAHRVPAPGTDAESLVELAAAASRPDSGDPLDVALGGAGLAGATPIAEYPFTEARRRETIVYERGDAARLAALKGAPETVLALCSSTSFDAWRERIESYAETGHKVIAVATQELSPAAPSDIEPMQGYRFRGLLAFEDPVREGVREAVVSCKEAGISVLMITGDHPATAEAVAREAGFGESPAVITAEALDPSELSSPRPFAGIDVVARAAPTDKLRIVEALRSAGEIVAVTGDGVNDVPALKAADVGIAMGERGTQSAREAAAVVLLDDNFRTIVRAIAEGRQLFLNLQLAFVYLLLIHIPFVVSAAAIPLAGHPLLYLPVHIVWLELVIHPTAMLVFQSLPASERLPPAPARGTRIFQTRTWARLLVAGLALAALIGLLYELVLQVGGNVEQARSATVGALIAISAAVTIVLGGMRSRVGRGIIVGQVLSVPPATQVPSIAALLHLGPLGGPELAAIAAAGGTAAVATLAVKASMRERRATRAVTAPPARSARDDRREAHVQIDTDPNRRGARK